MRRLWTKSERVAAGWWFDAVDPLTCPLEQLVGDTRTPIHDDCAKFTSQ